MRMLLPVLALAFSALLAPGVAAAGDADTYRVSESWTLTHVNGDRRIVPRAQDDVVELTCHNEDQMTDWWVNDEELVARSWEKADGTGVQVRPAFPDETETLEITLECERM